jgi:predicted Zn-dependent protease
MAGRFAVADVFFEATRRLRLGGEGPPEVRVARGVQLRGVAQRSARLAWTHDLSAAGLGRALAAVGARAGAAPRWPAVRDEAPLDAAPLVALLRAVRRRAGVPVSLSILERRRAVFRAPGEGVAWRERTWLLEAASGGVSFGRGLPVDVAGLAAAIAAADAPAAGPCGRLTVVFAPGASGVAMHELVGHALEADHALSGDSAFAGRAMGDEVAPGELTVVDDPDPARGAGGLHVDDEGCAAGPVVLVDGGRLAGLLHDRVTAAVMGGRARGNGRRASVRHEPAPRMRNVTVAAGPHDPGALLSGIRDGLYVERASGWSRGGRFALDVHAGRRIRAGALAEPVGGVSVQGAVLEALAALEGVGRDVAPCLEPVRCGKRGDVLTGAWGPTLRFAPLEVVA